MSHPKKLTIAVKDTQISDLKSRLAQTRWPDQLEGVGWEYGSELSYLKVTKALCRRNLSEIWRTHTRVTPSLGLSDIPWASLPKDNPPLFIHNLHQLQELAEYWQNTFDWRKAEASLNSFANFELNVNGIELHFIHERSSDPDAIPILLSHGWPGSVFEFHKIIPKLTDPGEALTWVIPLLAQPRSSSCPQRFDRHRRASSEIDR